MGQEYKFKAGDIVRCVNARNATEIDEHGEEIICLIHGRHYQVEKTNGYTDIHVVGIAWSWDVDRFELVQNFCQTVMVYDNQTEPLCYIVFDKDLRHLNRTYINEYTESGLEMSHQEQLIALLYDQETGKKLFVSSEDFPVQAVLNGAHVITCGFLG